jgi:myo-inositol-1(or 4)-monophosphatase
MPEGNPAPLPRSSSGRSAYEVARYASLEAGKILKSRFGLDNKIQVKGRRNLVTEADLMSEKKIIEILKYEFPAHGILSEEAGASQTEREYVWIIDPLDGTNNFHFGIPFFCVNIALVRRGEVVVAVTYDPMRREMFHSVKGKGAYLNRKKSVVSPVAKLADASIGIDLGYVPDRSKELLSIAGSLWSQVHCLRLMGSSCLGLAYVSNGRLGIYFHKFIYPWDIASGLLLIREAGGRAVTFSGADAKTDDREIIAGNRRLLSEFTGWLAKS